MRSKAKLLFIVLLATTTLCIQQATADGDGGEIDFKSATFSHEAHGEDGAGFDCDSCHDGLFEMEAGSMQESADFSMNAIYEGEYCGACHDGDTAFSSSDDCTTCHTKSGGEILYTEPVKSVIFSHQVHGEAFGCESCHDGLFKMEALAAQQEDDFTMESLYQGKYCGTCHDGDTAFASDTQCATCHLGVKGYNRMMGTEETKGH